jgi:coproporphyrinogen III oxidase
MLRTALASISLSGLTFVRSFVSLKADTGESSGWAEPSKEKVIYTSSFNDDEDEFGSKAIDWMADPLTDAATLEKNKDSMRVKMELMIMRVQREFCRALETEENPKYTFHVDRWTRSEGGGGITCVLQDGHTFEKAGVNVSVVHGKIPPAAVAQMNARGKNLPEGEEMPFFACGISSVVHPRNPNIPTVHFNFRYFEVVESEDQVRWWFGGGADLTPYYLEEEDVSHFHKTFKNACDKHNNKYYKKFKAWADDYFQIKHRGISRGVGGIFFDDLDTPDRESAFNFVTDCADAVIPSFMPLVKKHREAPYGYAERQWQLVRRGHYAEFNLVYDRGTKFGLYTPGARYESILMSLPLNAKWEYMNKVRTGSREAKLTEVLKNPQEWV